MCNFYSITTNQAAIIALFRVINRYVGNLPPMPGVFPDYPAPVIRNTDGGREMVMMRWGMPPPPRTGGPPVTNIRNSPHCTGAVGSSQKTGAVISPFVRPSYWPVRRRVTGPCDRRPCGIDCLVL
jgi:hypothetical protein